MPKARRTALPRPDTSKTTEEWAERIKTAKAAREAGKELRKDKPATFPARTSPGGGQ
jgi:hypothetical protein